MVTSVHTVVRPHASGFKGAPVGGLGHHGLVGAHTAWDGRRTGSNGGTAALGFGDDGLGFWGRLASAALILVVAAGLVAINVMQDDDRVTEVANLDAALLTDDLPPEAYADPGFLQYLKTGADASTSR